MVNTRELAAIMFTDIVGYTALMGNDEQKAFELLKKNRQIQKPIIDQFGGRWIKELGDGVMTSFHTVSDAVNAAIKIQRTCNAAKEFQLRIGVHLGEVVFENDDVFGDGVNIASRIQALATPGSIWVSEAVHHNVSNKNDIATEFVKVEHLKNVKEPVRIYQVKVDGVEAPTPDANLTPLKPNESKTWKHSLSLLFSLGVAVIGVSGYFIYSYSQKPITERTTSKVEDAAHKSIAVIPFVNLSNDQEQEYFAEGFADDILDQLVKTTDLKVKSRTATLRFKNTTQDPSEIGRALGVSTILEGTIWKSGEKIKIVTQLIDVVSGNHLFSETYDREMKDIFEVRGDVAKKVALALRTTFNSLHSQNLSKYTPTPEAYNAYLKGRFFWNQRSKPALFKGLDFFQQAIGLDPLFARAYSGIADCYTALGYGAHLAPKDSFLKAKAAASRALELDSTLAEPHASLGYYKLYYGWDWSEAEVEFLKAISLDSTYVVAYDWYGTYLTAMGRFDEAHEIIKKGEGLDPLSVPLSTDMGFSLYYSGQYDQAMKKLSASLEMDPKFLLAHLWKARVYQQKKMYPESIAAYKQALTFSNDWPVALAGLGNVFGTAGQKDEARKILADMKNLSSEKFVTAYGIALVYAGLGETDNAFQWLNKAYDERSNWLVWLKLDPRWYGIRSDKRFDELARKVGLPI